MTAGALLGVAQSLLTVEAILVGLTPMIRSVRPTRGVIFVLGTLAIFVSLTASLWPNLIRVVCASLLRVWTRTDGRSEPLLCHHLETCPVRFRIHGQ